MALKMLLHTFRMIFGNFGQALRISIGPYLILMVCIAVVLIALSTTADSTVGFTPMMGILPLLLMPVALFVTAWVAVSWHRFILKEEYAGILPSVSGKPIWPYAGKAILLGLLIFVISIPIMLIVGFAAMPFLDVRIADPMNPPAALPLTTLLIFVVALTLIGFVSLRFAVALVGTAMEKPMGFGDGWKATKPLAFTILGVSFILVLINFVPTILPFIFGQSAPILQFVLNIALSWLTMMLGISILTTIYGHVIEGRPLAA